MICLVVLDRFDRFDRQDTCVNSVGFDSGFSLATKCRVIVASFERGGHNGRGHWTRR